MATVYSNNKNMHYKNIDWKKEIKEASDVALLKTPVMHSISRDKQKTQLGYYIIIIGGILSLIGNQLYPVFFRPSLLSGIYMAILQIVGAILGIYIISFIAKTFFKGSGNHDEFFRVAAYGMIVMWLGLIPHLSFIAGIWELVIMFMVLKTVHKLSTGGIVGTLIVVIVIGMIIGGILSPMRSGMVF